MKNYPLNKKIAPKTLAVLTAQAFTSSEPEEVFKEIALYLEENPTANIQSISTLLSKLAQNDWRPSESIKTILKKSLEYISKLMNNDQNSEHFLAKNPVTTGYILKNISTILDKAKQHNIVLTQQFFAEELSNLLHYLPDHHPVGNVFTGLGKMAVAKVLVNSFNTQLMEAMLDKLNHHATHHLTVTYSIYNLGLLAENKHLEGEIDFSLVAHIAMLYEARLENAQHLIMYEGLINILMHAQIKNLTNNVLFWLFAHGIIPQTSLTSHLARILSLAPKISGTINAEILTPLIDFLPKTSDKLVLLRLLGELKKLGKLTITTPTACFIPLMQGINSHIQLSAEEAKSVLENIRLLQDLSGHQHKHLLQITQKRLENYLTSSSVKEAQCAPLHYSPEQIKSLLQFMLREEKHCVILNAVTDLSQLKTKLDSSIETLANNITWTILVPLAYENHWVGLYLVIKDKLIIQATYSDSHRGLNSPANRMLKELLGDIVQWAEHDAQQYNTSAAFLIENLYAMVKQSFPLRQHTLADEKFQQVIMEMHNKLWVSACALPKVSGTMLGIFVDKKEPVITEQIGFANTYLNSGIE